MKSAPDKNVKKILITGSTDGIGKLTAGILARTGAEILIHGRDYEKVRKTVAEVSSETGNTAIEGLVSDLSSLDNVRRLAATVIEKHDKIDILINNAGIGFGKPGSPRETSADGFELRFAVNYLAPFLLTHLLLPALIAIPGGRVINIASIGQAPIDPDDLTVRSEYSGELAYCRSKLALIMFTFELAERLGKTAGAPTVNCIHPGTLLRTKMVMESFGYSMGEPDEGADAVSHLAISEKVSGASGKYFDRKKEARAHEQAYDANVRKKLWNESEKFAGLIDSVVPVVTLF